MTAPSYPTTHRGVEFQLLRGDGATPTEAFTLLAMAVTQDFKRQVETDDAMIIDTANPLNTPVRDSQPKGMTQDITFSGKCDYSRHRVLMTDFEAAQTGQGARNYQLLFSGTGANGGGVYQGAFIITDVSTSKSDNGMVAFTATLKGQHGLTWTANA